MEFKSVQTGVIKTLFEALKELVTDCSIYIDETGLKINTLDATKTILVNVKLEREKFEHFNCPKKMVIGVNMQNLFKLIKKSTHNDTLMMSIDEKNTNILNIKFFNEEKNIITTYKFNLIDNVEDEVIIPDVEFGSTITMPSCDFQKLCRDMNDLSDKIELKSIGNSLIAACAGGYADQETIFGETKEGIIFGSGGGGDEIIQGYYNLKSLVLFTKCTGLDKNVDIYLKNNFPIIVTYKAGNLGVLKLCLAPNAEENVE